MKTFKTTKNGQTILSYNDSNIEWVISSKGYSAQRFPKSKWTMKAAVSFYAELNRI